MPASALDRRARPPPRRAICGTRSSRTKLTASTRGRPRGGEPVHELRAHRRLEGLGLVLEPVARADIAERRRLISAFRAPSAGAAADAAPARASSGGRAPRSSAASHAMIEARTSPPPRRRNGSGGNDGTRRVDERQPRPLVVGAQCERREDLPAEPARADAVTRVAGAVVEPRARASCRRTAGGRRRRRSARPTTARRARRRAPAAAGAARPPRARPSRRSRLKRVVDLAAEADRPGAAPHQHPPVVERAEVVDEHAPVDDRLAARPVDLLEQLGHRLGQHDVRAEVRQAPRGRPPAGERGVRRKHDLGRAQRAARRRDLAVAHAQRGRLLVDRHAGRERVAAQRAHEQARDARSPRRGSRRRCRKTGERTRCASSSGESATASSG